MDKPYDSDIFSFLLIPQDTFLKKEVSDKGDLILLGKESFECKDFNAILHSTFICAWGECYGRKK